MKPASAWRHQPYRYRLEASRCAQCGKINFPPRMVCDGCKSRDFETIQLSSNGRVVTFSEVHVGPDQFQDDIPYVVAVVELDEGVRLTCQVVDCSPDEVQIGTRVQLVFRKIQAEGANGVISYGYKAVLK
jgi:uncharacterized protein